MIPTEITKHARWVYRDKETGFAKTTINEAEAHRQADRLGVVLHEKTPQHWAAFDGKGMAGQFFLESVLAGVDAAKAATAGCEMWLAAKKLAVCDPELAQAVLGCFQRAFANDAANGIGTKPDLMAFASLLEQWMGMAPGYIEEMNQAEPADPQPPQKQPKGKSPFCRASVAWPLREGEFAHIAKADRKKLVRLLARVSENSYRRGYQQGGVFKETGVDGYTLREAKNLDWSPFAHAITQDGKWARHSGHSAIERLGIEYGELDDIALPVD